MSLMDKLKGLFGSAELPDGARDVLARAKTPGELLKEFETLRGRNEMELREHEDELLAVERALAAEESRVREGNLMPTSETTVLRRVERLQKQLANLETRVGIYNGNINLLLNLIAKVQDVEAMRLRGVGEEEIDQLLERVDESQEQYRRVGLAAGASDEPTRAVDHLAEQKRLDAIRQRIVGGAETAPRASERGRKAELE